MHFEGICGLKTELNYTFKLVYSIFIFIGNRFLSLSSSNAIFHHALSHDLCLVLFHVNFLLWNKYV